MRIIRKNDIFFWTLESKLFYLRHKCYKMTLLMAKFYKSFLLGVSFLMLLPMFAQETENLKTIKIYDDVIFFDGYNTLEGISDESKAMIAGEEGILRHLTSLCAVKLSDEQLSQIGDKLTMKVTVGALCDNYDRIGNINLAFVPKGSESYNPDEVQRIEVARFITPFMNKNVQPTEVPYEFGMDNVSMILRDSKIRADYDIWVEFELFGVPYAANEQVRGCAGRQDVFTGTLEFITNDVAAPEIDKNILVPVVIKKPESKGGNFNNYTEGATDVEKQADKTWRFNVPKDVTDGEVVLIISHHGANAGGEEYNRRVHNIYFDGNLINVFTPGRESCEPFRQYNTQPNGIYGRWKKSDEMWQSFSNWCPGDKIDIRIFKTGPLAAGEHAFRIKVIDAVFADQQGDFPVSIYFQGVTEGEMPAPSGVDAVAADPRSSLSINGDLCKITSEDPVWMVRVYDVEGRTLEMKYNTDEVSLAKCKSGVFVISVEYADGLMEFHKIIR